MYTMKVTHLDLILRALGSHWRILCKKNYSWLCFGSISHGFSVASRLVQGRNGSQETHEEAATVRQVRDDGDLDLVGCLVVERRGWTQQQLKR